VSRLIALVLGELERQSKGLELTPTSELLPASPKLQDEIARDFAH
jgi:hypothetical protein